MECRYHYLRSLGGDYVVTGIAKGGSRAGRISTFGKASESAPYLFSGMEDAQDVIRKDGEGDFIWKEPGRKAERIHIVWVVDSVTVNIQTGGFYI